MSLFLISTAILAATSAFAAPPAKHEPTLHSRGDNPFAIVSTYSDSACQDFLNNGGGQAVYGYGSLSCHSTNGAYGTQVKGEGCQTYFYNDDSCSSGQLLVPDSGCYANVGSFSIYC